MFKVDTDGSMTENIQNYEYSEKTAVHGMVFDPTETYIYSADMWANRLWCHEKHPDNGQLSLVGSVEAPNSGDHPRWVAMHPSGKYLYALMEAGNTLAEYSIDPKTHLPSYTGNSHPLVPNCKVIRMFLQMAHAHARSSISKVPKNVSCRRCCRFL